MADRWLLLCVSISQNRGEQGCAASALSKSKLADVFETNTSPRKCDGLMTVGPIEVGNLECKRVGASKAEVACQLRKNIKINKSILLQLEEYGLECPLLLSIHGNQKTAFCLFFQQKEVILILHLRAILGMSAIVFRVRKWKDVWVAGKGATTIVLPTTEDEFRLFLEDTVHDLCNLIVRTTLYSDIVIVCFYVDNRDRKNNVLIFCGRSYRTTTTTMLQTRIASTSNTSIGKRVRSRRRSRLRSPRVFQRLWSGNRSYSTPRPSGPRSQASSPDHFWRSSNKSKTRWSRPLRTKTTASPN